MLIFNGIAFIECVACGLASYGLCEFIGCSSKGPTAVIFGAFCALADVSFRTRKLDHSPIDPSTGGHIFFIPVWLCSVLFIGIGIQEIASCRPAIAEAKIIIV